MKRIALIAIGIYLLLALPGLVAVNPLLIVGQYVLGLACLSTWGIVRFCRAGHSRIATGSFAFVVAVYVALSQAAGTSGDLKLVIGTLFTSLLVTGAICWIGLCFSGLRISIDLSRARETPATSIPAE